MGQAKKKRFCPAQGRDITSADCGENRLSRLACPDTCPFNPFIPANCDPLLETEGRLDGATLRVAAREYEDPTKLADTLATAARANPAHGYHAALVWHLFFACDAQGRTFAQRWTERGMPELKNDERVLFRGKMQLRVALIEVHRIIDDRQLEAVDLLDPDPVPLRFLDRRLAATAVRFSTFLTWIFPLPHFWRMSGTGIGLTDVAPLPCREMLDECIRHLGGLSEPDLRRRWLAENFTRIDEVLDATVQVRHQQTLASMEGQFGKVTYRLTGPLAECRKVLAADPDVAAEELAPEEAAEGFKEAVVWFDADAQPSQLPGRRVLGRLLLRSKELRGEAIGVDRLTQFRARIESRLAGLISFVEESRNDLPGKQPPRDLSAKLPLVPARLLEYPTKLDLASSRLPPSPPDISRADYQASLATKQRWQLLNQALPMLGGRTPREAMHEPARRSQLIEWAKAIVRAHDQQNLQTGRTDDINELIRALSLSELDFPAPPKRAIPESPLDDGGDGFDDEFDDEDDLLGTEDVGGRASEWSAPPLPNRPLSQTEADDRMQQAIETFDTAAAAMDELAEAEPDLIGELWRLCEPEMNHDQFGVVTVFVVQLWFALVPRGRSPLLRYERIEAQVDEQLKAVTDAGRSSARVLEQLIKRSPQPKLFMVVAKQIVASVDHAPATMRLAPEAALLALVVLNALIAELDHAVRE